MEQATYVTRFEEIVVGGILLAVTMAMHGVGMLVTVRATERMKRRFSDPPSLLVGIGLLVVASWMIALVHLLEVTVWARFLVWKKAMANISVAYYFSLLEYTTVGSEYNLPLRWRLLEGMLAIAGLMTFAWSTGVLVTLGQDFQDQQLRRAAARKKHRDAAGPPAGPPSPRAG
ncbi:MAG TPA: hypothetical protein VEI47_00070 [Gemmatimonadales bacterium]|nr:hypothetical protein [Gemmatimonadales bacterium]